MRKKLTISAAIGLLVLFAAGFSSCTEEKYYDIYQDGAQVESEYQPIKKNEWIYNEAYRRYEYVHETALVDRKVFEGRGIFVAGVYMFEDDGQGEYEVLRSLPFVYYDKTKDTDKDYQLIIGYDISYTVGYSKGTIMFYLQAPEYVDPDEYVKEYEFKMSKVYDPE